MARFGCTRHATPHLWARRHEATIRAMTAAIGRVASGAAARVEVGA
jgi:hypothetical protein